jgi:copper(I)-binding protein
VIVTRAALLAAAVLVTVPALAQAPTIEVRQPWSRATPGAARTGVVYFTLHDKGAADRLVGVSTPVAGMAMLHESIVEDGIERMRMLDALPLPAGGTVALHPHGPHVMLTDLRHPLERGSSFPLTLTFERAPPVTVTVPVLGAGAAGPAESGIQK